MNERIDRRTMEGDRKHWHHQRQQHMNAKDKSDYFRCRTRINANTCDENLNSWNMECYIHHFASISSWRTHRPSYGANNNNLPLAACIFNFNEHFYEIFSLNCALVCHEMEKKEFPFTWNTDALVSCPGMVEGGQWHDVRSPRVRSPFEKLNIQVNGVVAVHPNYYYYYLFNLGAGPVRSLLKP